MIAGLPSVDMSHKPLAFLSDVVGDRSYAGPWLIFRNPERFSMPAKLEAR